MSHIKIRLFGRRERRFCGQAEYPSFGSIGWVCVTANSSDYIAPGTYHLSRPIDPGRRPDSVTSRAHTKRNLNSGISADEDVGLSTDVSSTVPVNWLGLLIDALGRFTYLVESTPIPDQSTRIVDSARGYEALATSKIEYRNLDRRGSRFYRRSVLHLPKQLIGSDRRGDRRLPAVRCAVTTLRNRSPSPANWAERAITFRHQ